MIPADILAFCDHYCAAFNQLDGAAVAQLYALPCGIASSHASRYWSEFEPVLENMRQLCEIYRRDGYHHASYSVRCYLPQSTEFAFLDIAWTIHKINGLPDQCFNTSYQLVRTDDKVQPWRVLLCTAYSESPAQRTPMRPINLGDMQLEPQLASHASEMFEVLADPAIYTYENSAPESLAWLSARFQRLESRRSQDGSEQWLNWVIKLSDGKLAGFVQATIAADGSAHIAYILHSRHWGKNIAYRAVQAMLAELHQHYGVSQFHAIFKTANLRSQALLQRLGFSANAQIGTTLAPDESAWHKIIEE
ncbi:MAG: GNAT family N-acetyltransferase [Burkholderiales bacterium]|nr:GNAT family N-acetyltransferase [Burkholderiales bacterium]